MYKSFEQFVFVDTDIDFLSVRDTDRDLSEPFTLIAPKSPTIITRQAGEGDDFPADTTTTGFIPSDGTPVSGTLESADDVDWFRFEVEEGDISLEFTVTGIEVGANLYIFDANGDPYEALYSNYRAA